MIPKLWVGALPNLMDYPHILEIVIFGKTSFNENVLKQQEEKK
jgi:hypothetical protein